MCCLYTEVYAKDIQSVLYQRFHCVSIPYTCIWNDIYVHLFEWPVRMNACMNCLFFLKFVHDCIFMSGAHTSSCLNPDQCHQELVEYYHYHVRPPGEPILIPVVWNTNTVSQQQHCSRYTRVEYIRELQKCNVLLVT